MDEFARALVVFFAIIDPLGNLVAFDTVTRSLGFRARLVAALLSTTVALGILVLFALTGTTVLDYLGISLESFQVSSGLLLGITAIRLVERGEPFHPSRSGSDSALGVVLVPLATPMLAGPGAIATTIAYTTILGRTATLSAAVAILMLTAVVFVGGSWVFARAPKGLLSVLTRVVGILLTAIAVDLILDGLQSFF